MNLGQLQCGDISDVAIEAFEVGGLGSLRAGRPVQARRASKDLVRLTTGSERVVVRASRPDSSKTLASMSERSSTLLSVIGHDGSEGVLRGWSFPRSFDLRHHDLTIQITPHVLESLASMLGSAVTEGAAQTWFRQEFILDDFDDEVPRFVVRVGTSVSSWENGFVLVGATRELDVRAEGRGLRTSRLAPRRNGSALAPVLVTANLRFSTDLGSADEGDVQLAALLANDSYLRQWARYGEAEFETETQQAREYGSARYDSVDQLVEGTWRFYLVGASELLQRLNTDVSLDANEANAAERRPRDRFTGEVEVVDRARRRIDLRPIDPLMVPPPSGSLEYSVGGAQSVHRRRLEASRNISSGNVPLPELAAILELRSVKPRRIKRKLSWDSAATRRIFSGSEPTEAQKRAIETALNTPDIAVIQGPPGTGKTQVIAAIAARVAEESGDTWATRQVLLSSFQHDAVDNVASRTVVFGLPAVKETTRQHGGSWLSAWRQERLRQASELFDGMKQGRLAQRRAWLVERRGAYLLAPVADDSAADLLEDIIQEFGEHLSTRHSEVMRETIASFRRPPGGAEKNSNLIAAIRSIRTTPDAHCDDGLQNVRRVRVRLDAISLSAGIDRSLLDIIDSGNIDSEIDFVALERLKNDLLDVLGRTRLQTFLPSRNDTVVKLLNDTIREVDEALTVDGQGLADVLSRFVSDLESDPRGVENALAQYSAVVASTCQAAASLAVRPEVVDARVTFNTVIVDEAARANPLDLQIPMSIASERIVLVGDQRQLPHIVDDKIAGAIASGETEMSELEESLFGRLFRFLEAEVLKGRPRRTVTLNAQFRMHRRLGDFVSRNFYEPLVTVESPRPDSDFAHELPGYEGKVAHWIDVPTGAKSFPPAKRVGTSWARVPEARLVAAEAKRLMESSPHLSVGIITFYRAQVALIHDELASLGVADPDPGTGELRILSDNWRYTTDSRGETVERLRVGTVDAFQGKEFDVVILSTVRTPQAEVEATASFGHLQIMNRLCVALSRQRRFLLVVGDRHGITEHPDAAERLAPLCDLARLCAEEGS